MGETDQVVEIRNKSSCYSTDYEILQRKILCYKTHKMYKFCLETHGFAKEVLRRLDK